GFSTVLMMIILMVMGLSLLISFNLLIVSWQKAILMESQYYQKFNQASSSLTWAIIQNWQPPKTNWYCMTDPNYHLKACIKKSLLKIDNYVLVRGEAKDFYLYTLTHFDNNRLIVEKGHWLDYCPEKKAIYCE
ncbi:MAG: YgdB family protein, partial [Gilliamella sp.]|nr:YgdB family protein [Gilliamella sp.]